MHETRFDIFRQRLTREGSRRQLLGGIGGIALVLSGAGVLDAKNSKGKAKGKGKGKQSRATPGKGHGSASAPGRQPKEGVCHFDEESGLYIYLELPPPAVRAHLKHGDQLLDEAACLELNSSPTDSPEE